MFWLPLIACFVASPQTVKVVNPDGSPAVAAKVWVYPAHGLNIRDHTAKDRVLECCIPTR